MTTCLEQNDSTSPLNQRFQGSRQLSPGLRRSIVFMLLAGTFISRPPFLEVVDALKVAQFVLYNAKLPSCNYFAINTQLNKISAFRENPVYAFARDFQVMTREN